VLRRARGVIVDLSVLHPEVKGLGTHGGLVGDRVPRAVVVGVLFSAVTDDTDDFSSGCQLIFHSHFQGGEQTRASGSERVSGAVLSQLEGLARGSSKIC
jgi:hypothetical protein